MSLGIDMRVEIADNFLAQRAARQDFELCMHSICFARKDFHEILLHDERTAARLIADIERKEMA